MEHILTIFNAERENEQLLLYPIEEWPDTEWHKLKDGMRMLADSDALTFVYVLDLDGEFIQLRLPSQIWPQLAEAYTHEWSVSVSGPKRVPLTHFHEEMNYLLSNIAGNGNYGTEMVDKVEKTFQL
ncbi:hypothetical protein [Bacillus piscicola]|uniref:UPF0738 family protein n=1 Tax=Bacillus piscicola TaxID=1632684 RepID=UPI001F091948|nr:hypothetical protein [Bacillus piscicola]